MLLQVPVDVSLKGKNPAAGQTPWKGSGLMFNSLSSAGAKGTSWSSSSGLYALHSAVSFMSLDLESELDSMVTFGS